MPRFLLLVVLVMALLPAAVYLFAQTIDRGLTSEAQAESEWRAEPPAKLARTEVTAARVGRYAYVIGGFAQKAQPVTTAVVERYDLRARKWDRVAPLPVPLNHAASASAGGFVYVAGGYADPGGLAQETDSLWRYSPRADRWKRLAPMPTPRGALGLAAAEGKLYAAGGAVGGGALKTLEVYDIARNRWTRGPDMSTAREHAPIAALAGFVYAPAGRSPNLSAAERFDIRRGRWEKIDDLPEPTSGHTTVAAPGRIVVFGGEAEQTISQTAAFNPRTGKWRRLSQMRTPRHGLGGVYFAGRVYAFEGGPQPGFAFSRKLESLGL
jgi:N-acetylneuraminic acid mutarotase